LENLIKVSSGAPFFPGGPTRASSLASNDPSQSRPVTLAKWNQPLFLQGTSDTDTTPTAAFPAPHWIYVSSDSKDPNPAAPNPKVVGRYAYAIYNEGGLLDINAAGFPITGSPADAMGAYRTNMGFVDLTKLKGGPMSSYPNTPLFDAPTASALVGWRNYASAQASGSGVTGYSFSSGNGTATKASPYFKTVIPNSKGFLQTVNNALSGGVSDRIFVSRQQLIEFLKALGQQNGGTGQLLASLQYLTTFSRALEQPSFSFPGGLTGNVGLPGAPTPYALGRGGNDQVANTNSSFLKARANSIQRIDGSTAVAGEPLVKKRFPLARLAWLTYDGPSANRTGGPDITRLKDLGVTSEYLALGTAANIQKAFGLTWNGTTKRWTYMAPLNAGHIRTLSQVAAASAGEPNFFELLKAAINVGSLAKPAGDPTLGANGAAMIPPTKDQIFVFGNKPFYFEQSKIDASVDLAILQLGANIIDQADADGWPTQIEIPATTFASSTLPTNNGGSNQYALSYRYPSNSSTGGPTNSDPYVFTGVENLPYIFRIRWVAIRLMDPQDDKTNVTKTGLIAGMLWPEIWNPHGYDASPSAVSYALGDPRPKDFSLTARDAVNYAAGAETLNGSKYSVMDGMPPNSADWLKPWGFEPNLIEAHTFSEANSKLTFTVPDGSYSLFREPTLLNQPNKPAGSGLSAVISGRMVPGLITASGVQSSTPSIMYQGSNFVGFYLGAGPARWNSGGMQTDDRMQFNLRGVGQRAKHGYPAWIFTLKASGSNSDGSPREVRYDTKRVVNTQDTSLWLGTDGFAEGATKGYPEVVREPGVDKSGTIAIDGINYYMAIDPRTSRWNFLDVLTYGASPAFKDSAIAPGLGGWGTPAGTVLPTYRPDTAKGTAVVSRKYAEWNAPDQITSSSGASSPGVIFKKTDGWETGGVISNGPKSTYYGYFSENKMVTGGSGTYYADADKIVRRASGGYSSGTTGLPLAKPTGATPSDSRPIILNRPFRSVAELGAVFSGTPWKNLNFAFRESGDSALLDVFCLNEVSDPSGLVAGKFDLNTSQVPVVKAIVEGAYQNELSAGANFPANDDKVSEATANSIAQKLVTRTSSTASGKGPLTNISDLVGYYKGGGTDKTAYEGFGTDLETLTLSTTKWPIQRYAESAVRALSNTGQTRVWNLMIDVIAQTGKFPPGPGGASLAKFAVDGEKRYWVHLAIDRFTGKVLDQQVETVSE